MDLSVIVCSYNRAKYIRQTIDQLCNQVNPSYNYEILIIDNNSTDETKKIVNECIQLHQSSNLKYILEERQGLTFARNRGISEAKGKYISFIDDDGLCNEHYVKLINRKFEEYPEAIALGGKVLPIYPESPEPKWLSKPVEGILSKLDLGSIERPFPTKFPVGCNMAFRKEAFEKYGHFNENLVLRSDEKDFFLRLKANKEMIYYIPELIVEHVMSKKRISKEGVKKVSIITGEGEYYRNKLSVFKLILKLIEFISKLVIAVFMAVGFLLLFEPEKAIYIIRIRYHILIGFLFPEKNLNPNT